MDLDPFSPGGPHVPRLPVGAGRENVPCVHLITLYLATGRSLSRAIYRIDIFDGLHLSVARVVKQYVQTILVEAITMAIAQRPVI